MQTIPFSEARAQLASALRSVEAGSAPFSMSRRGQVAGVLMSFEQYQRLSGEAIGFVEKLNHWRAVYLAPEVAVSDGDHFTGLRQPDAAREFFW